MYKTIKTTSDLKKLKNIASDLANDAKKGDLFFLKGELGSGKTTFIRLFINFFFEYPLLFRVSIVNSICIVPND